MVERWTVYASSSYVCALSVIFHAYWTRAQFYPAVIYLVTSKLCVMILCNAALVTTVLIGLCTKSIFLGKLRDAEMEVLSENARYAIVETAFGLTTFRDEMNLNILAFSTALLFTKIFHWLIQARLEHMEQMENVTRSKHVRIFSLLSFLSLIDIIFVTLCGLRILRDGPSVLLLFGSEFLVLYITLFAIFVRYILHLMELRSIDGTWENKSMYLFYLELLTEVTKLCVFLIFFMVIFTYYGTPFHLARDLWHSIRKLQRRIEAYFRYRRITNNMNERFPQPTEDELDANDRTCIICREDMIPETSRTLHCTHIFHATCLRNWLQHQQTCPTCRENVERTPPPRRIVPAAAIPGTPVPLPGNTTPVPVQQHGVPATNLNPTMPMTGMPTMMHVQQPMTTPNNSGYELMILQQELSMLQMQLFQLRSVQPRAVNVEAICEARITVIQQRVLSLWMGTAEPAGPVSPALASSASTAVPSSSTTAVPSYSTTATPATINTATPSTITTATTAPSVPAPSVPASSSDLEEKKPAVIEKKPTATPSETMLSTTTDTTSSLRQRRSPPMVSEMDRKRDEQRRRYEELYQNKKE